MTSTIAGSDEVRVARDGGVVSITMDRPADQNRITRDVLLTLHGLTEQLASDEAAQVVVLTGAGREFFSMGILVPPCARATPRSRSSSSCASPTGRSTRSRPCPRSSSPR